MWPAQSALDIYYGNPRGHDGGPNPAWESANLVRISTPWALVTAWDGAPVKTIRVHRLCADSLQRVFAEIWQRAQAISSDPQSVIERWGMHLFAGAYQFRATRGSSRLSTHSWGCAVDFDSARNGLGNPRPHFALCHEVLGAFAREGWVWGGEWSRQDGMHWQAATV